MKTLRFYSVTAIGIAVMFATVLIVSCTNNKEEATAATTPATSVSKPAIDIHTAVVTDDLAALKQHIGAGTDLNERDPFGGSSPLISAALLGKTEAARMLIDAGADINFQNNDGSTALHVAAFFCRPEIVALLLEHHADKTILNKYNATAYDNVAGAFSNVKNTYDIMVTTLGPLGLKLDYSYLEKTRPEIADMLIK